MSHHTFGGRAIPCLDILDIKRATYRRLLVCQQNGFVYDGKSVIGLGDLIMNDYG